MAEHDEHLRILAVFHYVVGGLAALVACFPFIYLFVGIAMVVAADSNPHNGPPAIIGFFFIAVALAIILAGWALAAATVYAGYCLQQRRRYMYCFVMAGILCVFFPFGTVLGVFTILVLLKPEVKAEFGWTASP